MDRCPGYCGGLAEGRIRRKSTPPRLLSTVLILWKDLREIMIHCGDLDRSVPTADRSALLERDQCFCLCAVEVWKRKDEGRRRAEDQCQIIGCVVADGVAKRYAWFGAKQEPDLLIAAGCDLM
jgi:hypothetical protein